MTAPADQRTLPAYQAYLLLAFVATVWGVNWPIMKLGLADMAPLWFAAWRMGLAGI